MFFLPPNYGNLCVNEAGLVTHTKRNKRSGHQLNISVADPRQRGIQDFPKVECQPIIWPEFDKNCMKMKKIGPRDRTCIPNFTMWNCHCKGCQGHAPYLVQIRSFSWIFLEKMLPNNSLAHPSP